MCDGIDESQKNVYLKGIFSSQPSHFFGCINYYSVRPVNCHNFIICTRRLFLYFFENQRMRRYPKYIKQVTEHILLYCYVSNRPSRFQYFLGTTEFHDFAHNIVRILSITEICSEMWHRNPVKK